VFQCASILSVTLVTRARPQLLAEPNRIENLYLARRSADELLGAQFTEYTRHHFAHRSDAVGEILLAHARRQLAGGRIPSCGEIEQVPRDPLANRRERVARELFEHVIQAVN